MITIISKREEQCSTLAQTDWNCFSSNTETPGAALVYGCKRIATVARLNHARSCIDLSVNLHFGRQTLGHTMSRKYQFHQPTSATTANATKISAFFILSP